MVDRNSTIPGQMDHRRLRQRLWGAGMIGCVRKVALLFALAASASQARAATQIVQVNASVSKPLSLARLQDLDLGQIILGPGTWSGATVSISRTGIYVCSSANVTCSGAPQAAGYTVTGTNNAAVRITAPNVVLTNQGDPSKTLTLTVDSPSTVTLPNSGAKGADFSIGGAIAVSSDTAGGTYAGTFNVTVDY
jgi:hypothetical protein